MTPQNGALFVVNPFDQHPITPNTAEIAQKLFSAGKKPNMPVKGGLP